MGAARDEAGGVEWARAVVARYEAGRRVPEIALRSAMQVLGLKPGTVIRLGQGKRFDRMAVIAGSGGDD